MCRKFFILSCFLIFVLAGCSSGKNNQSLAVQQADQKINSKNIFSFEEIDYDFGKIKQSGGKVSHDFIFTYNGAQPIKITSAPTSCACTSAKVDKTAFNPGDQGVLTVSFNPNLHAEPEGKFFKTIMILTELKLEIIPEVKIWVEIDLDLGPEAFELKTDHQEEGGDEIISQKGIHWHVNLSIDIKGKKQEIPFDVGLGFVHNPIHTHDDGLAHLEFNGLVKKSDIKLGRFFEVWGKKFNQNCIFEYCNNSDDQVKMLVNGQESKDFENYIMRDGDKIEIKY